MFFQNSPKRNGLHELVVSKVVGEDKNEDIARSLSDKSLSTFLSSIYLLGRNSGDDWLQRAY